MTPVDLQKELTLVRAAVHAPKARWAAALAELVAAAGTATSTVSATATATAAATVAAAATSAAAAAAQGRREVPRKQNRTFLAFQAFSTFSDIFVFGRFRCFFTQKRKVLREKTTPRLRLLQVGLALPALA